MEEAAEGLKRKRGNGLYDDIVPDAENAGYVELVMKLKFTQDLIEFTQMFLRDQCRVWKKDEFEMKYWKALIGLRMFEGGEEHVISHPNTDQVFLETQNVKANYSHIKDFLQGTLTSDEIITIYIEFLKPQPRKLVVIWKEFLEIIDSGFYIDVYISALIYREDLGMIILIDRSEKVIKWFARTQVELNQVVEVKEKFNCKDFAGIFSIQNWTNDEFLMIIRKFYYRGEFDQNFDKPEGFSSMILHDIYSYE